MTNVLIGGASGIGRAVAAQLASRGLLLLVDRSLKSLEPVAAEIGGTVETIACAGIAFSSSRSIWRGCMSFEPFATSSEYASRS